MILAEQIKLNRVINLQNLINDRFSENVAKFAKAILGEDKKPTEIYMYINQSRSISEKKAREYENKLGLPPGYLDKDHSQKEEEIPAGKIRVPVYNIKASAGIGSYVHVENIIDYAVLSESILQRYNAEEKDLSIVRVDGNSMDPTLHDGEEILVNHSIKSGIDNRIFIISTRNEIWVKRFRKTPAGDTWESDNNDYKKYDYMYNDGTPSTVRIIGLVLRSLGRDL